MEKETLQWSHLSVSTMQAAHVANAASALLGTHALLAPSPVSPRRPLTSAIWPSPRALSPRPLPAASGSLDDFVKRQDAENQKRLQVRVVFGVFSYCRVK
jgi:hypothetical protein